MTDYEFADVDWVCVAWWCSG